MAETIAGVEVNESSRFIDHTLATPWEELIVSIENAIKALLEGEIHSSYSFENRGDSFSSIYGVVSPVSHTDFNYNNQEYRLERRLVGSKRVIDVRRSSPLKKKFKMDSTWLQDTYGIKTFLILTQSNATGDYSASSQTAVRSAFIIAVKNLKLLLTAPVFFSFSCVKDIGHVTELIGFQYTGNNSAEHQALSQCHSWLQYESHLNIQMHDKHPLFFFDGLRKVFKKKLRQQYTFATALDQFYVTARFSYVITALTIRNLIESNLHKGYSNVDTAPPIEIRRYSSTVLNNSFLKFLLELKLRASARFEGPTAVRDAFHDTVVLSELNVQLLHGEQLHSSVIDNGNYTTYSPLKLMPGNWSMLCRFESVPLSCTQNGLGSGLTAPSSPVHDSPSHHQAMEGDSIQSNVQVPREWMSSCIRKLLSFYIFSIFCDEKGVNVEKLSYDIFATGEIVEKTSIEQCIEVLSPASREAFSILSKVQLGKSQVRRRSSGGMSITESLSETTLNGSAVDGMYVTPTGGLPPSLSLSTRNPPPTASAALVNAILSAYDEDEDWTDIQDPFDNLTMICDFLFPHWSAESKADDPVIDGKIDTGTTTFTVKSKVVSDLCASSSIGHWMCLCSIICGTASGDANSIARIWNRCMRSLHNAWEAADHIFTFRTSSNDGTSETFEGKIHPDCVPVCYRTLWEDVIQKKRSEGMDISWPDPEESIIVQKLQMVQFCMAVRDEDNTITIAKATGQEDNDNPQTVDDTVLFRRLPVTADIASMHQFIARRLSAQSSQCAKDHPLLQWQVQIPCLLSDVRAFVHANPAASMDQFCSWYGMITSNDDEEPNNIESTSESTTYKIDATSQSNGTLSYGRIPKSKLTEIWNSCIADGGTSCADQSKVPFSAEKEAEKAIAYLERVNTSVLAAELLTSALRMISVVLTEQVKSWIADVMQAGESEESESDSWFPAQLEKLNQELQGLEVQVNEVIKQLKLVQTSRMLLQSGIRKSKQRGGVAQNEYGRSSIVGEDILDLRVFILVDSIAELLQTLERYIIKADILHKLFTEASEINNQVSTSRLHQIIFSLVMRNEYSAQSDSEVRLMTEFVKLNIQRSNVEYRNNAGFNENSTASSHIWHSHDGRMLGAPQRKWFTCGFGKASDDKAAHVHLLQMDAHIEGPNLRVTFLTPENI